MDSAFGGRYFALPRRVMQQDSKSSRKRRRDISTLDEVDDEEPISTPDPHSQDAEANTHAARLTRWEYIAWNTAGLPHDLEPPGGSYPYQAASSKTTLTPLDVDLELESMSPPLYVPTKIHGDSPQASEKQQHIIVLNTILHRCLLQGDYQRARRAFGMLLRSELSGRAIDLRASNFWAIGVEILLQSHTQSPEGTVGVFEDKAFNVVSRYFERLFVQHGSKRSELSLIPLYKAYFVLWIRTVYYQHKQALARTKDADSESSSSQSSISGMHHAGATSLKQDVFINSFKKAEEIMQRLNKLEIESPSYFQDPSFLSLKNLISDWKNDLEDDTKSTGIFNDSSQSPHDSEVS